MDVGGPPRREASGLLRRRKLRQMREVHRRRLPGKLQPDLQVAPLQVELADAVFFQKLDELFQLCYLFRIHASRSFLVCRALLCRHVFIARSMLWWLASAPGIPAPPLSTPALSTL